MRNLGKVILLVMLTAGLSSCEKIKSIFDVEIETTLSGDLDIDIQESAMKSTNSYEFESSALIIPTDDEDIDEYSGNIKDFAVDGVLAEVLSVEIENLELESVVFEKETFFYIKDNLDSAAWKKGSDWEIVEGTVFTLEDLGNIYNVVEDILNRNMEGQFTVGVDGVCSETGVSIVIRLGIKTTVTANPL